MSNVRHHTDMPSNTLSAYVLPGESLIDREMMVGRVNSFISSREWKCAPAWAVDQERVGEEGELGLNLVLPEPYKEPEGWYEDVEAIVALCVRLRRQCQRDFVISIADATGVVEDIIEVNSDTPKTEYLRAFVGVGPPAPTKRDGA